jgi:cell division septation protein DedD
MEGFPMGAGRIEPHGGAETHEQGGWHEPAESWEKSGDWAQAEAWDYDEARAGPQAYDRLELQSLREREAAPRFERFHAAVAETIPLLPEVEVRPRTRLGAAVGTGRFWASALWLAGAAAAGVLAGVVSTDLLALALKPQASSLVAAPAAAPRPTLSAVAPWPVTSLAPATVRPATPGDDAPLSIASLPSGAAASAPATAKGGSADIATPPAPGELQVALAGAAPDPREATYATPIDPMTAPADRADRGVAPDRSPAAAEATPATATAASAVYRVQLALLRDKRNVESVWQDFVARIGPSAEEFHRYVFPTRTAHGTRHLVQIGPFADETGAEALCGKLKERGGDCLVVREPS